MDFRNRYPEYADIDDLIRRARAERAAALGELIAQAIVGTGRFVRNAVETVFTSLAGFRSRHAADAGHFAPGSAHR